tara:strand:+ start:197 stop:658 length:462 start_codon:yes stop_codon:yes gene_type:complete
MIQCLVGVKKSLSKLEKMCFFSAHKQRSLATEQVEQAIHQHVVVDNIFGDCDTVLYTNDTSDSFQRLPYTHQQVDEKKAIDLLGVKMNRHYLKSPVQTLPYDLKKDLKIYALRNCMFHPLNKMLLKHHGISWKGPVVVSRCNTSSSQVPFTLS